MRIHSCFCAGGSDSILSTNVIGPSNSLIISPAEISSAGTLNWYPPLAPRTLRINPAFLKGPTSCSKYKSLKLFSSAIDFNDIHPCPSF